METIYIIKSHGFETNIKLNKNLQIYSFGESGNKLFENIGENKEILDIYDDCISKPLLSITNNMIYTYKLNKYELTCGNGLYKIQNNKYYIYDYKQKEFIEFTGYYSDINDSIKTTCNEFFTIDDIYTIINEENPVLISYTCRQRFSEYILYNINIHELLDSSFGKLFHEITNKKQNILQEKQILKLNFDKTIKNYITEKYNDEHILNIFNSSSFTWYFKLVDSEISEDDIKYLEKLHIDLNKDQKELTKKNEIKDSLYKIYTTINNFTNLETFLENIKNIYTNEYTNFITKYNNKITEYIKIMKKNSSGNLTCLLDNSLITTY